MAVVVHVSTLCGNTGGMSYAPRVILCLKPNAFSSVPSCLEGLHACDKPSVTTSSKQEQQILNDLTCSKGDIVSELACLAWLF